MTIEIDTRIRHAVLPVLAKIERLFKLVKELEERLKVVEEKLQEEEESK